MGNIYYKQKKFPLAVKMYRMALDDTPNAYKETRYHILRNIGNAFMRLGQYQDAIRAFELVMENKIDHQTAYNLTICYYVLGNREQLKNCFTKMLLVKYYDSDSDDENEENSILRGHVEEAKVVYREAAEVELVCVEAIYNLGLCHKKLGAVEDALSTFKKLINFLPNNIEVLFQVGQANELIGDTRQAIKWLEVVNTRTMHDSGVLAMLGSLFAKCDDEPKALHYYSESHRVYPANMDITSWLGAYYVKNEVYEKAMPFFDLASKIQPNEIKWQLMVASCHRRTGGYTEALAKYKSILSKHPENVECLRHLLHMCTGLGRRDEVRTYEAQLRKVEMDIATESRSQMLRIEPAKEVPVRSIEFGGDSRHSTRGDNDFSPRSSGSSSLGSRIVNSNLFTSSSVSSSSPPQRASRGTTKKKTTYVEEDAWPELGDDLLPM